MKKLIVVLLFLVSMFAMRTALAEPVAVIVNSANAQNISMSDVKNIYMDQTVTWENGENIAVYNLPPEDVAAELFARKVLGVSARDSAAAESNRVISNTARNPQQFKREALISSIVAKSPNAIGFIPQEQTVGKTGLRVIFTLE